MKKFKKFLGMALAVSLVFTSFPGIGKAAKAADTTSGVKINCPDSWESPVTRGTLVAETTATENMNKAKVTVKCASDTNFNSYCELCLVVTVNGEEKETKVAGTGNWTDGETVSFDFTDFSIKTGDTYKIEAYTYAYTGNPDHKTDYVFEVSIGEFTYVGGDDSASDEEDSSTGVKINCPDSWESPVTRGTLVAETTATENMNKAKVTVKCASDTNFNSYCELCLVVTVNGEEKETKVAGTGNWTDGETVSFDFTDFSIKTGDTYKIEAYTYAYTGNPDHKTDYVFEVSIGEFSFVGDDNTGDNDSIGLGKIYYSGWSGDPKVATVMTNSIASKAFNSLKVNIQCASDTSFNPWSSICFVVIVNGRTYEKEIKGDDENYTNGALRSCVLDGFTVQKDDYVSVQAYTHSWADAKDYVFECSIDGVEELGEPTDVTIDTFPPIIEPTKPTAKPSAEPTVKPTETPSVTPSAEPTAEPSVEPSEEPTATPDVTPGVEPTTSPSAKPTKAPALDKGDKFTVSGSNYKVTNAVSKTVNYIGLKNNKTSLTVPATVKATVDGKKVTYKVTGIADNAFKNDKDLKKITVGKNIKTIGASAFKNCAKLQTIIINSSNITKIGKNALKGTSKKLVIKVPAKKVADYKKLFKGKGNSNLVIKKL